MKMFKATDYWSAEIKEVEIEGMTEKFVKFKAEPARFCQKRELIQSSCHFYSKTKEEVKQWLFDRNAKRIKEARKSLEYYIKKAKEIEKL